MRCKPISKRSASWGLKKTVRRQFSKLRFGLNDKASFAKRKLFLKSSEFAAGRKVAHGLDPENIGGARMPADKVRAE
jgi:hypothetical protein